MQKYLLYTNNNINNKTFKKEIIKKDSCCERALPMCACKFAYMCVQKCLSVC